MEYLPCEFPRNYVSCYKFVHLFPKKVPNSLIKRLPCRAKQKLKTIKDLYKMKQREKKQKQREKKRKLEEKVRMANDNQENIHTKKKSPDLHALRPEASADSVGMWFKVFGPRSQRHGRLSVFSFAGSAFGAVVREHFAQEPLSIATCF